MESPNVLDDNFDITEELHALLAAINPYAGRNSKLDRSIRARFQLRDRRGRFIFMGGGSRATFRLPNGAIVSVVGRSAGASSQQGKLQMYVGPGSTDVPEGFYLIDSTKTNNAKAIIPGSVPTAPSKISPTDESIVNVADLERLDAPEGWTKNEDGSYTSADGEFEIRRDSKGRFELYQNNRRVAKDLDTPTTALTKAAKIDIQDTMDKDTKKVVARLKKDVTAAKNLNKDNVLELEQDEIDARIKKAEDKLERALFNDPKEVGEKDPKQEALTQNLQSLLSDAASLNAELEKLNADYDALEKKTGSDAVKIRKRRNEIKAELENNAEDLKAVQDELEISPESDVIAEIPEETDAEAPTEAPAAKKAAPLDNMKARVEEIKNEIASLEQSGNSKENRDKIAELQAEKKTLEDNIAILSPTEDKQLDIPETKTPTAEEVNRKPAPGEGPTPEEEAAEWKPSNEPTRYFIDGKELSEDELEDWVNNAKSGDYIYLQTQKDGKPILERYVRGSGAYWHTFTGKLDDLNFENDEMIDFIRQHQNKGSILTNVDPDFLENSFPEDIAAAIAQLEKELGIEPKKRKKSSSAAHKKLADAFDGYPPEGLPSVEFDSTTGPDASWVTPNEKISKIWPGDVVNVDGEWKRVTDRKVVTTLVPSADPDKKEMSVRNYTYTFEDGSTLEAETVNGQPKGETRKKFGDGKGIPVAHIDPRRHPEGANREQVLPEGAVKPGTPEAPAVSEGGKTRGLAQETYDRLRADLSEKFSQATGGLDLDEEEKAISMAKDSTPEMPRDFQAALTSLDNQIETLTQQYNDAIDADADSDTLANLDDQIAELENQRQQILDIYNSKPLVQDEAMTPGGDESGTPKTKQEADKRLAALDKRIDSLYDRNAPQTAIDAAEAERKKLASLRNKLPNGAKETTKEGEKDGGKPADTGDGAGADSGRKGKVPGEVSGGQANPVVERQGHTLRDRDGNVVGTFVEPAASAERHKEAGKHVPDLFEVSPIYAELFRNQLIKAAEANKHGASVTIHDLDYYQQPGVRLFMTQDGNGGVALNGDEIVTGFMHPDAADRGNGSIISMVDKMVELGGRRLDAFDTILPKLYSKSGFKAVARLKFNPEFAPSVEDGAARDWDEKDYADYNGGRPDVVFMVFDPNQPLDEYNPTDGEYIDAYDLGADKQNEALAQISGKSEETDKKDQADTQSRNQDKQRVLDELEALRGSDNMFEGDVPKSKNGNPSVVALREAESGQVIEYKFANGKKARFIKVGKDVWVRADNTNDRKTYRSGEFARDKSLKFVPGTSEDQPSAQEAPNFNPTRPAPYRYNRKASDDELNRLIGIYKRQLEYDTDWKSRGRAQETIEDIERLLARRRGENVKRKPYLDRTPEERDRMGADARKREAGGLPPQTQRKTTAKTLPELKVNNDPIDSIPGYNTDPYTPENPGGDDDPEYLATVLNPADLTKAFQNAVRDGSPQISVELPDGSTKVLPIEAVRDTLQRMGKDTNVLIKNVLAEQKKKDQEKDSRDGVLTGEPGTGDGENPIDRISQHANRLREIAKLEAEIAARLLINPDDPELLWQRDRAMRLRWKINRDSAALGLANIYALDTPEIAVRNWNPQNGDVVDPEFVLDAVKNYYGDRAELMPNGDIKLAEVTRSDADGNMFKYETFVTKTDDNMFYTYVRQTNLSEPDETKKYTSVRGTVMRQSATAVVNQTNRILKKMGAKPSTIKSVGDIHTWFMDPNNRLSDEYGAEKLTDILDENGMPVHAKDRVLTRATVSKIREAMDMPTLSRETITSVFNLIASAPKSEKGSGNNSVLLYLQGELGFSIDDVNRFVDAVNSSVSERDQMQKYSLWHDKNGVPLMDGDIVTYRGDATQKGNKESFGKRYIVRQRLFEFTSKGKYTYTDYVYVDEIDENGNVVPGKENTPFSANNFVLDETAGGTDGKERMGDGAISLPLPTPTTRAFQRWAGQGRVGHFAPYMSNYKSLASPTINIDGVDYKVQASRARLLTNNLVSRDARPHELEVGDFIPQTDPDTKQVRLAEIVDIKVDAEGNRKVTTVLPVDLGSAMVSVTNYAKGFEPTLAIYRENVQTTGDDDDRDPLDMPINEDHRSRIAAALRSTDTSKMSPEALELANRILKTPDLDSLGLTVRDAAEVLRDIESIKSRDAGTTLEPVTIQQLLDLFTVVYNRGSLDQTTLNNLEKVRRALLSRGWEIDVEQRDLIQRILSSGTGMTPGSGALSPEMSDLLEQLAGMMQARRGVNGEREYDRKQAGDLDRPFEQLQEGPFDDNAGASSLSIDDVVAAASNKDYEALQKMLYDTLGNKSYSKYRLANIKVTSSDESGMTFSAELQDSQGKKVGMISRAINFKGDPLVPFPHAIDSYSVLDVNSTTDAVFGAEFQKVSDNFFKSLGLQGVTFVGNGTTKNNIYAKSAGYTWQDKISADIAGANFEKVVRDVAKSTGQNPEDSPYYPIIERLKLDFNDPNFPEPAELIILGGGGLPDVWWGIKYLDPSVDPRPEERKNKKATPAPAVEESPVSAPESSQPSSTPVVEPEGFNLNGYESADEDYVQDDIQSILDDLNDADEGGEFPRTAYIEQGRREGVEVFVEGNMDDETLVGHARDIASEFEDKGYVVSSVDEVGDGQFSFQVRGRYADEYEPELQSDRVATTASTNVTDKSVDMKTALDNFRSTLNPDDILTNPDVVKNGELPVGTVLRSTSTYASFYSIKTEYGWESVVFNSGSYPKSVRERESSSDNSMAGFVDYRIGAGQIVAKVSDPAELDRIERFRNGEMDVVEPTRGNMQKALAERDTMALSSMFYHTLFNGGDARYGELTVMNFNSELATSPDGTKNTLVFYGDIYNDQGEKVGTVERKLVFNDNEEPFVLHQLMDINKENRGRGFSSEFSAASEDLYRQLGLDTIRVSTDWDGSYVWAKAGYDWDTTRGGGKGSITGKVRDSLKVNIETAKDQGRLKDAAALQDILDRMQNLAVDDPNFPSPSEIANLQSENQSNTKFGRELLTGTGWIGIKKLGNYGKSGDLYADENFTKSVADFVDNLIAEESLNAGDTPGDVSIDGWEFQGMAEATKERATELALARLSSLLSLREYSNVDAGLSANEMELRKEIRRAMGRLINGYRFKRGNVTVEIEKELINTPQVRQALETLTSLSDKYPTVNNVPSVVRFRSRRASGTLSGGALGTHSQAHFEGGTATLQILVNPESTSPQAGGDWFTPAGNQMATDGDLLKYILMHEFGHLFDFSFLAREGDRLNTPAALRDRRLASTLFRRFIEAKYPGLIDKISGYVTSRKDTIANVGSNETTKTLEAFAEAFAQMVAEDMAGMSESDIGKAMREFLRGIGVI